MPANVRVFDVIGWVSAVPALPAQVRVFYVTSFPSTPPGTNANVRVFSVKALPTPEIPGPTVFAGADIADQEPWEIVSLVGVGNPADGTTIVSYQWTQLAGTVATIVDADKAAASVEIPGSIDGEILTFGVAVTDSLGVVSNTDAVSITTLPCASLIVRGGVWTPYKPVILPG